jgi:hypothetical protein
MIYQRKCAFCGCTFETDNIKRKYCSLECRTKAQYKIAQSRCSPSISACLNCTKKECTYGEKPTEEEMSVIKGANLGENLLTVDMKVGG